LGEPPWDILLSPFLIYWERFLYSRIYFGKVRAGLVKRGEPTGELPPETFDRLGGIEWARFRRRHRLFFDRYI